MDHLVDLSKVGRCARREVVCTIVDAKGRHYVGTNFCLTPQAKCPRSENEDYSKCKTICQQVGHAEEVAVLIAGQNAVGGHAYIEGHSYACRNCQERMFSAGVKGISVGKPPKDPRFEGVFKPQVAQAPEVKKKRISLPELEDFAKKFGRAQDIGRNIRIMRMIVDGLTVVKASQYAGCSLGHATNLRMRLRAAGMVE